MKIFLVGGGTGGPTAPLLAVAEALEKLKPGTDFFFVGCKKGVEIKLLAITRLRMNYLTIPAGKWRRYFSLGNLVDLFRLAGGFLKSLYLLNKHRPDLIFGAGSYVQVPVVFAGALLGIPAVVHQQDFRLLLATRLCAPLAKAVTVSFSYSGKNLPESSGLFAKIPRSKIVIAGNPVRKEVLSGSVRLARKLFSLSDDFPTVLVMGGGTGSARVNEVVRQALPELVKYVQIIHSTGGKVEKDRSLSDPHYHAFEFLGDNLKHAYAVADLVVSRGGMSTISELARLGKAAILVPLQDSPQVDNVEILARLGLAVGVPEDSFSPELLVRLVRKILWDREIQKQMQNGIKKLLPADADKRIASLLVKISEYKQV